MVRFFAPPVKPSGPGVLRRAHHFIAALQHVRLIRIPACSLKATELARVGAFWPTVAVALAGHRIDRLGRTRTRQAAHRGQGAHDLRRHDQDRRPRSHDPVRRHAQVRRHEPRRRDLRVHGLQRWSARLRRLVRFRHERLPVVRFGAEHWRVQDARPDRPGRHGRRRTGPAWPGAARRPASPAGRARLGPAGAAESRRRRRSL